ncbi:MAG: hypothetical protein EU535_00005 [Promethearchaeota archaeon]|nr:MAG: hypothetical protein EU535_00005 [Candidatus Lokiarchaeota archaeon]
MSMYRSYLLKNGFWARKGNEKEENFDKAKAFIKHDVINGGIYAIIQEGEKRGVKILVDGDEYFFNNFDNLDNFLNSLTHKQDDFIKILKRKNLSKQLRRLEI